MKGSLRKKHNARKIERIIQASQNQDVFVAGGGERTKCKLRKGFDRNGRIFFEVSTGLGVFTFPIEGLSFEEKSRSW